MDFTCQYCKQRIDEEHKFCPFCGILNTKDLELDCGQGVNLKFRLIPAGEFKMGEDDLVIAPKHKVVIKKPFYMGVYPVTQEQFEAVTGKNFSTSKGAKKPVHHVSWKDAAGFCVELSTRIGMKVHLPSEAQWEYACRAGNSGIWNFGDAEDKLDHYAWYSKNCKNTPDVGQKKPNTFGLFDMHGCIWEWNQDQFCLGYNGVPADGSAWEGDNPAAFRIARGGCWAYSPNCTCSAFRYSYGPGIGNPYIGFRIAAVSA